MPSRRATSLTALVLAAALCATTVARAETCGSVTDNPANVFIKLLAPPPCDACEETKAEVRELAQIQAASTPAEVQHATDDIHMSVARFLGGADLKFDAAKLETCSGAFFERLSKVTRAAANNAKNTFCRTRPYDLPESTVRPFQQLRNSKSYPSGHTTWATVIGTVLAHMVPEKREEIIARIADFGHSRMVAGMHFRSDVDAGKILGASLAADQFASDDEFKAAYPDVAACVRGALGLPSQDH